MLCNMLLVVDAHHPYLSSSHTCLSCQSSPVSFAFIWSLSSSLLLSTAGLSQVCPQTLGLPPLSSSPSLKGSWCIPFLAYLDII